MNIDLLQQTLRAWEKGFEKKNGRKPTNEDIKYLPRIKQKYRRYEELYAKRQEQNQQDKQDLISTKLSTNNDENERRNIIRNSPSRQHSIQFNSPMKFQHSIVGESPMKLSSNLDSKHLMIGESPMKTVSKLGSRHLMIGESPMKSILRQGSSSKHLMIGESPLKPVLKRSSKVLAIDESPTKFPKAQFPAAHSFPDRHQFQISHTQQIKNQSFDKSKVSNCRNLIEKKKEKFTNELLNNLKTNNFVFNQTTKSIKSRKLTSSIKISNEAFNITSEMNNTVLTNINPHPVINQRRDSQVQVHGVDNWQKELCHTVQSPVKNQPQAQIESKSEYETEREKNIKANQDFLNSLGLGDATMNILPDTDTAPNNDKTTTEMISFKEQSQIQNQKKRKNINSTNNQEKRPEKRIAKKAKIEVSNNFVKINLKRGYKRRIKPGRKSAKTLVKQRFNQSKLPSKNNNDIDAFSNTSNAPYERCVPAISSSSTLSGPVDHSPHDIIDDCLDILEDKSVIKATSDKSAKVSIPFCTGHKLQCSIYTVKKKNENYGRQFYGCSLGYNNLFKNRLGSNESKCNFFKWADDNKNDALDMFLKELTSDEYERQHLFDCNAKWGNMTAYELKVILKKRKLPTSGKKDDLVIRLIQNTSQGFKENKKYQTIYDNQNEEISKEEQLKLDLINLDTLIKDDNRLTLKLNSTLTDVFQHKKFRSDQLWCIKRIMNGESTLLIQPTGVGKSLCYQLPSLLLPGLTLVISPLISLMQDQLNSLPACLPAACLSGKQSRKETVRILKSIKENRIKILYISPERLFSSSFQRLMNSSNNIISYISLLCIDEAHCISSWSHNFRPSYLRLKDFIFKYCNNNNNNNITRIRAILAMTATATPAVANDIKNILNIKIDTKNSNAKSSSWYRANLRLHIRYINDNNRLKYLINLLNTDECLRKPNNVIIYTRTRYESEMVAERLRIENFSSQAYHSGIESNMRKTIQSRFLSSKLHIVVATVAFGMGIDKSNVRGVVHYGMPRSIEDYTQEIGRSGRDGNVANCFALFDNEDALRIHSLSHADSVDKMQVKLLMNHFLRLYNNMNGNMKMNISLSIKEFTYKYDIREGVFETILVYLSQHPFKLIKLMPSGFCKAKVTFLKSVSKELINTNLHIKYIVEKAKENNTHYISTGTAVNICLFEMAKEFDSFANIGFIIKSLCTLRDEHVVDLELYDAAHSFRFTDHACNFSANFDSIVDALTKQCSEQIENQAIKIEKLYACLKSASEIQTEHADLSGEYANAMKPFIDDYFDNATTTTTTTISKDLDMIEFQSIDKHKAILRCDIKRLLTNPILSDDNFVVTSMTLTKIFHGITSPCFKYADWTSNDLFNKYINIEFKTLRSFIHQELLEMKCKNL